MEEGGGREIGFMSSFAAMKMPVMTIREIIKVNFVFEAFHFIVSAEQGRLSLMRLLMPILLEFFQRRDLLTECTLHQETTGAMFVFSLCLLVYPSPHSLECVVYRALVLPGKIVVGIDHLIPLCFAARVKVVSVLSAPKPIYRC